jgi:hypothetical protein
MPIPKIIQKISAVLFCIICTCFSNANAKSTISGEDIIGRNLSVIIKDYQIKNGHLPTSWEQLGNVPDIREMETKWKRSYSVIDRYEFIAQPMSSAELGEGSRVLLIRTVPKDEFSLWNPFQTIRWRVLIVLTKDGEVYSRRMSEDKVQDMLKASGVALHPKPGSPKADRINEGGL